MSIIYFFAHFFLSHLINILLLLLLFFVLYYFVNKIGQHGEMKSGDRRKKRSRNCNSTRAIPRQLELHINASLVYIYLGKSGDRTIVSFFGSWSDAFFSSQRTQLMNRVPLGKKVHRPLFKGQILTPGKKVQRPNIDPYSLTTCVLQSAGANE